MNIENRRCKLNRKIENFNTIYLGATHLAALKNI